MVRVRDNLRRKRLRIHRSGRSTWQFGPRAPSTNSKQPKQIANCSQGGAKLKPLHDKTGYHCPAMVQIQTA
jgi:hypothetical protein